jgi:hypothetical protein
VHDRYQRLGVVVRVDTPAFVARHVPVALQSLVARNRQPGFVVVGTGRCGTGYVAELLTQLSIRCGHERIYSWRGIRPDPRVEGDASWLAVPYLPRFGGVVLHVVRRPLDVIGSFVGSEFFTRARSPYARFLSRHLDLGRDPDPLTAAMRHYVEWNRRCEPHASFRFRIEETRAALPRALEVIGHRVPPQRVAAALERTPTSINARARSDLAWSDLPPGGLRDSLVDVARRYGYDSP